MIARFATVGAMLVCAAVIAYCLFLIVVGSSYEVVSEMIPGGPAPSVHHGLVPTPQAVVPLALAVLVSIGIVLHRLVVAWPALIALLVFGFLTGFSIGGAIFLAGLVLVFLLLVAGPSRLAQPPPSASG